MSRAGWRAVLVAALCVIAGAAVAGGAAARGSRRHGHRVAPRTPIQHVVVIFQENVSFDHYFATYPKAANTDGHSFHAAHGTPAVDGLLPAVAHSLPRKLRHRADLARSNPNAALPRRLDSNATGLAGDAGGQLTCDQDHDYSDEQQAFDRGRMDHFIQSVGTATGKSPFGTACNPAIDMDYYDGNTVTAMWNYAQHYALSDYSFGTTFGPSAPGAINLASGDTGTVDARHQVNSPPLSTPTSPNGDLTANGRGGWSLTSDAQPYWDDCSTRDAVALSGRNIGDELNAHGLSWGWFEGGFRPTTTFAAGAKATGRAGQPTSTFIPDEFSGSFNGKNVPANASNQALCDAVHPVGAALGGSGKWGYKDDYIPHHEPFQFYASTANPHHLTVATNSAGQDTAAGLRRIGRDTQSYSHGVPQFNTPNHQYDVSDFDQLVAAINAHKLPASALPSVSFLKAPGYEDGHAGYSDPADEQAFVVGEIDALMRTPDWALTVVIVNWDDSDGWYDHVYSGVTNPSRSPADNLTGTTFTGSTSGLCDPTHPTKTPRADQQGRCGFGPRLPLLVISPYARVNHVDSDLTDQSSIINFIEYNWHLPGIAGSADRVLSKLDRRERIPFDLANMFDFSRPRAKRLILGPATGAPVTRRR